MRSTMTCLVGVVLIAPLDASSDSRLRVVRTYTAYLSPVAGQEAPTPAKAIAAHDTECGTSIGPHELLKPETPPDVAAAIAQSIDAANVPDVIETAFARAAAVLPGGRLTVCIYAAELSRGLPFMGGVGGLSLGNGRVKLFLHPTKEKFARVPYTIAHEYHHEVLRTAVAVTTGVDVVVQEGKADHFAVGLYPHLRPPHTAALSDQEFVTVWRTFLEYEHSRPPDFSDRFMIARTGTLPRWAGYRLAYEIVGHYLGASPGKPADWLTAPAGTIVNAFKTSPRVTALISPKR